MVSEELDTTDQVKEAYEPSSPDKALERHEEIWDAIEAEDDWKPFNEKIASIQEMGQVLGLGIFFKK